MTGYTVHTGSNPTFVTGWDRIFGQTEAAKLAANAGKKNVSKKASAQLVKKKAAAKGAKKKGEKRK